MKKESSLVFTGDIGFDKYMDGKWDDQELVSEEVRGFLKSGDHLIINVEGPISPRKQAVADNGVASLLHTMNPGAVNFFNSIGADIWNICNNHIMDAGRDGMKDTLDEALKANALTLGAGMNIEEASSPIILEEAGGIGLIGVGYQRACRKADIDVAGCFSWSDLDLIQKRIDEIKEKCRWCVIVAHAGEEFTALPSPYTRERYLKYLEMGADVVVAHHPHVPMNYETVGDKVIFYSLGNFIFDTDYQRAQFNTEKGIFVKLNFTEHQFSFDAFGININRDSEHVEAAKLPEIFEDVNSDEYEKLSPLAAKMFIENTKRQWRFLKPEVFENADEDDWYKNFYEPLRSGRVPGETLDFQIIYPLAQKESEKAWESSSLQGVKEYILSQLQ